MMKMDDIKTEKSSEKKSRTKKATAEANLTFEEAMTRLEAVVRALEDGKTPLEESMKLYEEGVSLVRLCSDRLEKAERRVKVLTADEN